MSRGQTVIVAGGVIALAVMLGAVMLAVFEEPEWRPFPTPQGDTIWCYGISDRIESYDLGEDCYVGDRR